MVEGKNSILSRYRFSSNLLTNLVQLCSITASFFTDSWKNGEELSKQFEEKNSPFYPLVSKAYYKDTKKKKSVILERGREKERRR